MSYNPPSIPTPVIQIWYGVIISGVTTWWNHGSPSSTFDAASPDFTYTVALAGNNWVIGAWAASPVSATSITWHGSQGDLIGVIPPSLNPWTYYVSTSYIGQIVNINGNTNDLVESPPAGFCARESNSVQHGPASPRQSLHLPRSIFTRYQRVDGNPHLYPRHAHPLQREHQQRHLACFFGRPAEHRVCEDCERRSSRLGRYRSVRVYCGDGHPVVWCLLGSAPSHARHLESLFARYVDPAVGNIQGRYIGSPSPNGIVSIVDSISSPSIRHRMPMSSTKKTEAG